MELNLTRVDYLNTGSLMPQCLKLIPNIDQNLTTQKLVAGNRSGNLEIIELSNDEAVVTSKLTFSQPIVAVELGGAIGTTRDKIFVGSGTMVRGFTKKGKQFLEFETNLVESIKCMCILGEYLITCSKNVCCVFRDCHEIGYFICDDEILHVITLPFEKPNTIVFALACKDRTIKLFNDCKLQCKINLDGAPTVMILYSVDLGESYYEIMIGTLDGKIGLVAFRGTESVVHWILDTEVTASITSLDLFDLNTDTCKELIAGFDDGSLQVYSFEPDNYDSTPPILLFSQCCNESIVAAQGGIFASNGFEEIVVATASGWIFGFTTETTDKRIRVNDGNFSISNNGRQKLLKMKKEIEELQTRVALERERYQSAATQESSTGFSVIPTFTMNDKMLLSKEEAAYILTLEVESPIDTILIQSDVPVDLLDVEKNSAVVSFSQTVPEEGNYLLVTFRCQANTTRIEVKLRTIEGQSGTVRTYVTPRIQPKCCQVRSFRIMPLSLHIRTHSFDTNRPYNKLTLRGAFSADEMHSWLSNCVPEMPDRTPSSGYGNFSFASSFLDTQLSCKYEKGDAEFLSDNASTISILKDYLTKEATKRKINLEIDFDFNEDSILHTLQLIRPKLEGFKLLSKQVNLINSLKEMRAHDPDIESYLSAEYKYILENAEKLQRVFKRQPSYLERLYGMIADLYIDKFKYKGINVKPKVPLLMDTLERQNFDALIDFFETLA